MPPYEKSSNSFAVTFGLFVRPQFRLLIPVLRSPAPPTLAVRDRILAPSYSYIIPPPFFFCLIILHLVTVHTRPELFHPPPYVSPGNPMQSYAGAPHVHCTVLLPEPTFGEAICFSFFSFSPFTYIAVGVFVFHLCDRC